MENIREVTLRLNMDNDMVRAWFERLMEGTQHPMYQNGIQLVKSHKKEEG